MDSAQRANALEERLIEFAVRIIKLSGALPRSPAGRHLSRQILRSGTAPAPNCGESRGAESYQDFVHKLGIVLKELNETAIWLQIISKSALVKSTLLDGLTQECTELCKIFTKATLTAKKKLQNLNAEGVETEPLEEMVDWTE